MPIFKIGDLVTLIITSLTTEGEGIGIIEGYKIYVPNTLINECIEVKLLQVNQTFAKATINKILEASSYRKSPPCPYFGTCGGCQLMHLGYSDQLAFKTEKVKTAFLQEGLETLIQNCLSSPYPLGYRSKIQLPIIFDSHQLKIGLFRIHSHEIVPIEDCALHCPQGEKILKEIREILSTNPPTNLRYVLIKNAVNTQEALVIFVTKNQENQLLKKCAENLLKKNPLIKGIVQNINPSENNVILGQNYHLLAGQDSIFEEILGKRFLISPAAFFQVNPFQIAQLYQKAIELADIRSSDHVIDAFCGVGTLAIFASDKAHKVYGIEAVPQAIEDAKKNCELNRITNCEFFEGRTEEVLKSFKKCDVLFLNPPRKGCTSQVLEQVLQLLPHSIIYISCNPHSLAKDLAFLRQKYSIDYVQPYDMFPQTHHVETLVKLNRIE